MTFWERILLWTLISFDRFSINPQLEPFIKCLESSIIFVNEVPLFIIHGTLELLKLKSFNRQTGIHIDVYYEMVIAIKYDLI